MVDSHRLSAVNGTTDLPAPAGRSNQLKLKNCWWAILDSNQGPQSYQDCALTS